MARYKGVDSNLCEVYRKIVSGTTANYAQQDSEYRMRGRGKVAERRRKMLMLAAGGMTDREIAAETGYSVDTVRVALYGTRYVKREQKGR